MVRQGAWPPPADERGQRLDVRRPRTATAADQIEPSGVEKRREDLAEMLGRLAVLPVLVGQAGVGDAGDARAADLRQRAHVVAHELGTGGAVQTDVEQVGVEQRDGERLGILAGEHRARRLDGHRDRDRHAPAGGRKSVVDAEQARLDVARVLAGLEQQVVGAAGDQTQRLQREVRPQRFEGRSAGDRDRLGRRSHRAADEPAPARLLVAGAGLARDRRREA
jgi:hypothetical protein